jgi:hypothetical protein
MAILALLVLLAAAVLGYFARAKAYSGPGVHGNLRSLQLAKDQWLADGNTKEWPTAADLFPASPSAKTFQEIMRPRYGELYFINRTGAPPFAYFPKAGGQHSAGDIVVLTTNGLMKVRQ